MKQSSVTKFCYIEQNPEQTDHCEMGWNKMHKAGDVITKYDSIKL